MRGEELLAGGVFLAIYALIVTERLHRTLAALLGAVIVIILGLIDQHEAFSEEVVDFNVIFLLAGMMIIANILGKTGIFQWLAVKAVRLAEGRPYRLMVLISLITAVASMFLDNVTTVVLMIWALVLGANMGGNATVVGASANVVVSSLSEARGHPITFVSYLRYGVPATLLSMVICTIDIVIRYVVLA